MYGKQTECAIAATSRLAEVYDEGRTRLNAQEIAEGRGLQAPFVAKILTSLSMAGIVKGSRGPGGGYTLARHPKNIKLRDVFQIFERENDNANCPFGGGVCGGGNPCPLHDSLVEIQRDMDTFLDSTSFDTFRAAYQERGFRPAPSGTKPKVAKRESYRARKPGTKRG